MSSELVIIIVIIVILLGNHIFFKFLYIFITNLIKSAVFCNLCSPLATH